MKPSGVPWHVSLARESAFAIAFAAVIHVFSFLLGSPELGSTPVAITGPIVFSTLLIRGKDAIPAVLLGFLLGEVSRTPVSYLLLTAITYTTVYLTGAAILRRISASQDPMEWVVGERSTAVFIGLCIIIPAVTGPPALFGTRWLSDSVASSRSSNPNVFLILHWARESAGLMAFGPFLLVQLGPLLQRWFWSPKPAIRCSIQFSRFWPEVVAYTAGSPVLLATMLWAKARFGLSGTCFALVPLLAASRRGIAFSSTTLALSVFSCATAWVQLNWQHDLDVAGFRALVFSAAVASILLAAHVERRQNARTLTEEIEEQLHALAIRTAAIREEERRSICGTIADDLRPRIALLRRDIENTATVTHNGDDGLFRSSVDGTAVRVDGLIRSVRRLATELRPGVLDTLGLSAAIEWLVRDFQKYSGIGCQTVRLDEVSTDTRVATLFFRLLEEVLHRIQLEESADHVSVALDRRNPELLLTIEVTPGARTIDVLALEERLASVGGSLSAYHEFDGALRMLVARVSYV